MAVAWPSGATVHIVAAAMRQSDISGQVSTKPARTPWHASTPSASASLPGFFFFFFLRGLGGKCRGSNGRILEEGIEFLSSLPCEAGAWAVLVLCLSRMARATGLLLRPSIQYRPPCRVDVRGRVNSGRFLEFGLRIHHDPLVLDDDASTTTVIFLHASNTAANVVVLIK
jgi:hypothetical protein